MVNSISSTQRVEVMARAIKSDEVWDEIFDNLIIESEPPIEYIKNVVITTKTGARIRVSADDFAQILERERIISPEESNILSCKLAINFTKVRKDVDEWAEQLIYYFDNNEQYKPAPKKRQPRKSTKAKTTKTPAKPTTKTPTKTTKAKTADKETKTPATRKPRSSSTNKKNTK